MRLPLRPLDAPSSFAIRTAASAVRKEAAHTAGMKAVGIGSPEILGQAELVIPGFANVTVNDMLQRLQNV